MKFTDLKTTKLGVVAEDMVGNEFIQSKGYFPFKPAIEASHPIDFIAMSGQSLWLMDVKAKCKMKHYDFTGIDMADFVSYRSYKHPLYILFVDPCLKNIYGSWLSKLCSQPSKVFTDVITWPLSAMTYYRDLTDVEVCELNKNQ